PRDAPTPASRGVVARLPTRAYEPRKGGASSSEDASCLVCLEPFCVGEQVMTLPCFHIFHAHCAARWLAESGVCPICKHRV
ncbi:zinc finger-containing protein, partial [Emiliania huxleyi CCMP1516]|uniref:RING-type domain-containing protein n=2 Tax=Emiliania huxleyi TaxID=2903 RepID=A0A0D3IZQ5_EMIH1